MAISVAESYRAFSHLLATVRSSMRNDSDLPVITKQLQHFFNKTPESYKTSAEFYALLQDTTSVIEQEQNKQTLDKVLLKFINELKAYKRCSNSNSQTFANNSDRTNESSNRNCVQEDRNGDALNSRSTTAKRLHKDKDDNDEKVARKRVCLVPVSTADNETRVASVCSANRQEVTPCAALALSDDNKASNIIEIVNSIAESSSVSLINKSITDNIERRKVDRQIRRLELLLRKLDMKIKKLQRRELSLSEMDEDDTSYIMEDKYKKKFMKVWQALCKLKGRTHSTGRCTEEKIVCEVATSHYPQLARKVENLLVKSKMFPDYQCIYDLVQRCDQKFSYNLGKNKNTTAEELARMIFVEVGKKLQARRKKDLHSDFGCFMTDEEMLLHDDPAASDEQLQQQLNANDRLARTNLDRVIEKYTNKQDTEGDDDEEDGEAGGSDTDETVDESDDDAVTRSNNSNSADAEEDTTNQATTSSAAAAARVVPIRHDSSADDIIIIDSQNDSMPKDNGANNCDEKFHTQRGQMHFAALPDIVTDAVLSQSPVNVECIELDSSSTRCFEQPSAVERKAGFLSSRDTINKLQKLLGPLMTNAGLISDTKRMNSKLSLHKKTPNSGDEIVEVNQSPECGDYQQFMLVRQKSSHEVQRLQFSLDLNFGAATADRFASRISRDADLLDANTTRNLNNSDRDCDVIDDDSTEDESGNFTHACDADVNLRKPFVSTSASIPDSECVIIDSD